MKLNYRRLQQAIPKKETLVEKARRNGAVRIGREIWAKPLDKPGLPVEL